MNGVLLDTHVWLWYTGGSDEISNRLKKNINQCLHQNKAYIAAITLWEIAMLEKKERIILEMPYLEWINKSIELTRIQVCPLNAKIANESVNLPGKFHEDPADRMIVASARINALTLITRDKSILTYSQNDYVSTIKV